MASSTTTSTSIPYIPPYMYPSLFGGTGAFTQYGQAQGALPSLTQLDQRVPQLQVPGLTPEQQQQIDAILAQGGGSPDLAAARSQLSELTSGPIGSSPYTQQAMDAWRQQVAPEIMQTAALQGRETGGAALEAMQQGATGAAIPLIQQEVQNREQAVGQYGQLQNEQMQNLAQALEAAGLPREVALQQAQAAFDQQQQQFGYETGLQTLPLQLFGNLIGQSNTSKTHETKNWDDWVGAIAKAPTIKSITG